MSVTGVSLGVRRLVVLVVVPIQEGELRKQLEDGVRVVVQRGNLTAVEVQTLQVLQALLQNPDDKNI